MNLQAAVAVPGRYADTDWPCSSSHLLDALEANDVLGLGRYVPLPGYEDSASDITAQELQVICARPKCNRVWLVQHSRNPGWDPTAHDPVLDATTAVNRARAAGYPAGCHIFIDLEGITGPGANARTVAAFVVVWQNYVIGAGYRAGTYVGFAAQMGAVDLFDLLPGDCYWTDMAGRLVFKRGCAIKQRAQVTIAGVNFDPDDIAADNLGGLPWVCSAASVMA